jgi:3-oxoacyl-[acyl-carrier-protein] synthase-1
VIVGAADTLCQMTVRGFSSLKAVSRVKCQPFSANRKGINIGEAAALFILSNEPSDIELYGVGCSSDAYHISAPEPDGKGAIAAINDAISQAPFDIERIDYVNLHGTATQLNDQVESHVVNQMFGEQILCSSTKSVTGHTLGAAAATELGLCLSLIYASSDNADIPPQVWDGEYDPKFSPINIVDGANNESHVNVCLSNSFAFGGNNTSLIIGRPYENL